MERPGDSELPLRERKKLQTKRRIKAVALELLGESTYEEVTVEQIADRSDVSPSTVYRYFQTKEGIFLWDEFDEAVLSDFTRHLRETDPITALTSAMADSLSETLDQDLDQLARDYMALIDRVPQLRQSFAVQIDEMRTALAAEVGAAGWPALDSAVFAGSMVGMFIGALETWVSQAGVEPLSSVLERATRMIVGGFGTVFPGEEGIPGSSQPG
ncbi:MAG: TetR/AcrR family transcriptional regulator [Acidimicrobiia bacterium]